MKPFPSSKRTHARGRGCCRSGRSAALFSRNGANSAFSGIIKQTARRLLDNTGNFIGFGARRRVNVGQKWHQINTLRANSLRIRTGNFCGLAGN